VISTEGPFTSYISLCQKGSGLGSGRLNRSNAIEPRVCGGPAFMEDSCISNF